MKKTHSLKLALLLVSLLVFPNLSFTQNVVKLEYKYYTSWFSQKDHIPIVVHYILTADMVKCPDPGAGHFTADPDHKDLTDLSYDYEHDKGQYDKGHNMSRADNYCTEQGKKECFYYSNCTPQPHLFNVGRWRDTEYLERDEAKKNGKVIVTTGSIGKAKTIGKHNVTVPTNMWKVIYTPSTKKYQCFYFDNIPNLPKPLTDYIVSLSVIESKANVDFQNGSPNFK